MSSKPDDGRDANRDARSGKDRSGKEDPLDRIERALQNMIDKYAAKRDPFYDHHVQAWLKYKARKTKQPTIDDLVDALRSMTFNHVVESLLGRTLYPTPGAVRQRFVLRVYEVGKVGFVGVDTRAEARVFLVRAGQSGLYAELEDRAASS